ncbi:MAG: YceH family protein [Ilumatobacteraceae bacterium]
MLLSPAEARVLACLIEKETSVPDSYPLTLNALRLACNQATNRHPVVAYDDRTVEAALLSLKSMGLVRFVHPAHGGRTIRYRHVADDRWRLSPAELGVLAVLVLRGAQTGGEVRARSERHFAGDTATVEEVLDTLAARSPEPFATRVGRRAGERESRWTHAISEPAEDQATLDGDDSDLGDGDDVGDGDGDDELDDRAAAPAHRTATGDNGDLGRDVAELWARVERLERLLGLDEDVSSGSTPLARRPP